MLKNRKNVSFVTSLERKIALKKMFHLLCLILKSRSEWKLEHLIFHPQDTQRAECAFLASLKWLIEHVRVYRVFCQRYGQSFCCFHSPRAFLCCMFRLYTPIHSIPAPHRTPVCLYFPTHSRGVGTPRDSSKERAPTTLQPLIYFRLKHANFFYTRNVEMEGFTFKFNSKDIFWLLLPLSIAISLPLKTLPSLRP